MNLTQNDRLNQVTANTLIVGVDVGSKTHFCRAFDWRGFELSKRVFKFSNTGTGFLTFLRWTEEIMSKNEMKKVKWASKKEMVKYSAATLAFIFIFAAFFSLTDLLVSGLKLFVGEYL